MHLINFAHAEPPEIPSNLEVVEVSSRSVKLSWRRPFDGNSPVLSYVVQYQPIKFLHTHTAVMNSEADWNSPNIMNITLPTISSGVRRYYYTYIICDGGHLMRFSYSVNSARLCAVHNKPICSCKHNHRADLLNKFPFMGNPKNALNTQLYSSKKKIQLTFYSFLSLLPFSIALTIYLYDRSYEKAILQY